MAFKPLIDYINDQLSMDMIVLDEEGKTVGGNTFIQQIGTVNGSANQQVSGVINSYNTNVISAKHTNWQSCQASSTE